jgi:hypothetical protein
MMRPLTSVVEERAVARVRALWSHYLIAVSSPLVPNPFPKRRIFLVLIWDETMAILFFECNQLFILLVPALGASRRRFPIRLNPPNEPKFVQKILSIKWHYVESPPLPTNPIPKRLVFLVPSWHQTTAILSFKLNKLFIFLVPVLVAVGASKMSFPN